MSQPLCLLTRYVTLSHRDAATYYYGFACLFKCSDWLKILWLDLIIPFPFSSRPIGFLFQRPVRFSLLQIVYQLRSSSTKSANFRSLTLCNNQFRTRMCAIQLAFQQRGVARVDLTSSTLPNSSSVDILSAHVIFLSFSSLSRYFFSTFFNFHVCGP